MKYNTYSKKKKKLTYYINSCYVKIRLTQNKYNIFCQLIMTLLDCMWTRILGEERISRSAGTK